MALMAKDTAEEVRAYATAHNISVELAKIDLHEQWLRRNLTRIRDYAKACSEHSAAPLVDLCELLLEEV